MTTFILEPDSEEPDELDSFMAELDADLKRSARQMKEKKAQPAPLPVPVQQWFPSSVEFIVHVQTCTCGSQYESVAGLYLVDIHRNGATRKQRHIGGTLPLDYRTFPHEVSTENSSLACCPLCYEHEAPAELLPEEPHRAVTKEDRDALRDLDQALGD